MTGDSYGPRRIVRTWVGRNTPTGDYYAQTDDGRTQSPEEHARAIARASQAERSLAAVTADRDAGVVDLAEAIAERDSLRAQLAKTEAVVAAARRWRIARAACFGIKDAADALADALRTYDDSGGSGAAIGNDAVPLARNLTPEPAGSSQDSPVGVAATAECEPKPYPRCEACDSSGIVAGPSGFDAIDCLECGGAGFLSPHAVRVTPYLTRAELVAAVRSAASAVGGPPRRALDALAEALEIPRT